MGREGSRVTAVAHFCGVLGGGEKWYLIWGRLRPHFRKQPAAADAVRQPRQVCNGRAESTPYQHKRCSHGWVHAVRPAFRKAQRSSSRSSDSCSESYEDRDEARDDGLVLLDDLLGWSAGAHHDHLAEGPAKQGCRGEIKVRWVKEGCVPSRTECRRARMESALREAS